MNLTRVAGPATPLLTVAEAKQHTEIDSADFDAQMEGFIAAATSYLDGPSGVLGRCLIEQTWSFMISDWVDRVPLPLPDVSNVAVRYLDSVDNQQTLITPASYVVKTELGEQLVFGSGDFPALSDVHEQPITIEMTAGYGQAVSDVPPAVVQAARFLVAHFFDMRGVMGKSDEMPIGVRAMIAPFRATGL